MRYSGGPVFVVTTPKVLQFSECAEYALFSNQEGLCGLRPLEARFRGERAGPQEAAEGCVHLYGLSSACAGAPMFGHM